MFVELDMSIRQIGHKLTMDGIPTPREARRLQGKGKVTEEEINEEGQPKLIPWTTGTLHMYLKDAANIGTLIICKKKKVLQQDGTSKRIMHPEQKIIPEAIPRIVSEEMYERAQRKLMTNRETKSHLPRNPEEYLLIGRVYCSLCNNRMHPIAEKGLPVYRCNKHMSILDANPHCEPHILRIKTSLIDPAVWENCCQVFERLSMIQDALERSIEQSIQNMLEDTKGRMQITALEEEIHYARQERDKHPEGSYYYKLIAQDIQGKEEQLRRYEEEFAQSRTMVQLSGVYRESTRSFLNFLNSMKGRYHEASFAEKRNALDVLGARVYISPRTDEAFTKPLIETGQEWLNISEISALTGIHRNSLMLHVHNGDLKSQKMSTPRIVIHRDEIARFLQAKQKTVDLSPCEEEWFTVHKLTVLKISTPRIIHQAIAQGEIRAETIDVLQTYVHRDELNCFLRATPIRQRGVHDTVPPQFDITYTPMFTGVQSSKDAQQVVNVVYNAGLARLVARLKPVIVVKG